MSVKSPTRTDQAKAKFRPQQAEFSSKELSSYFPKDEIFDKEKTYLLKKKDGEKTMSADWRNLHVGGAKIVLFKGAALSKVQLEQFNDKAKKHYLVNKASAKSKTKEGEGTGAKEPTS